MACNTILVLVIQVIANNRTLKKELTEVAASAVQFLKDKGLVDPRRGQQVQDEHQDSTLPDPICGEVSGVVFGAPPPQESVTLEDDPDSEEPLEMLDPAVPYEEEFAETGGIEDEQVSPMAQEETNLRELEEVEGALKQSLGEDAYDEFVSLLNTGTMDQSGTLAVPMSWDKELFMLKGGQLPNGIIVSSMRLLQVNLHGAMKLEEEGGTVLNGTPLYGLNLETDGKRKLLVNGWKFQTFGG
jgi:hypothetical protein